MCDSDAGFGLKGVASAVDVWDCERKCEICIRCIRQ